MKMAEDLASLSACEATDRIRQGTLKVTELCSATLAGAKAHSKIGAWTQLNRDLVLEQAESLDKVPKDERTSPLFGVTVGIKDIIHTKDMPTRHGSARYADSDVQFDASVVQILRRAGCVIFGKTVSTEMAFTMTGKHTLNPRNTKLSPGGSSSGSAAAVADNQVQIAVGTQTFGSVTRPASYCGIFGWKPTFGLISTFGGKFCSPTLDTIGFFARNAKDLKLVAETFQAEKIELTEAIPENPKDWKVGVLIPLGWDAATEDAKSVLEQCSRILQQAGASTEKFEMPPSFEQVLVHQRIVATKELATSWLTEGEIQNSDDIMLRKFYEEGKSTPYTEYLKALDNLARLRREFDDIAKIYTFIISLSATGEAPTGLEYTGDSRYNTMSTALHFPVVNVPGLKVSLDLDLSGNASGYTELSVTPTDAGLKTIFLHSRECSIKSVSVNAIEASFHLAAPLTTAIATPSGANNIRSTYPELKRRLYQAANEAEEGELAIVLPTGAVKKANSRSTDSVAPQANGADGAASPDPTAKSKEPEFEPIQITIEYDLRNPKDGIHVVKPSDLYPNRIPHCFTSSDTVDAARCWVPCVDGLWERCSWELVFSVPRVLSYEQETEQGIEVEEFPVVVVASGELIEQIVHPHSPNKTIFHFEQAVPTTVQHIGFAYGPFSIIDISPSAQNAQQEQDGDEQYPEEEEAIAAAADAEGQVQMHAFCLPGREDDLMNSVSFMTKALEFLLEEFGSYPFNSYKMIFVDDCPFSMFNTAGLGIFSAELLFPPPIIDQAYETRQALTYSLTSQWVGINIIQKTWADTWVIQGLSIYVNGLCLRKLMGNNEYRFRMKKDVARCCAWDVKMPPLCQPGVMSPPSSDILPFINLKAPLVMHILDRQLLKAGTHNGLSRIIPKLYLSAISGDLKENLLSTHNFLRMCRKVSGADLRHFADQWIYAAGCPRFHIAANFNRKRMAVELAIKQESPAAQYAEQAEWADRVNLRPINIFEGQMTVRIHEADGTPYEHVINIGEMYKKHEVSFNTKYKRIRRSTKRFQARKAAEEAAAAGDVEAIEAVGHMDTSFTLPLWEDSKDPETGKRRESWKVADWSEDDEKAQEQAVYEWIRIDTEFEWIAVISFEQPDFMWLSQLQRDRDVIAQLEAVHALARMPSPIVSSNLAKTVLVTNYFYRIRMEAALALVASASRNLDYLGLFYLFKIFQTRYCFEPERETTDPFAFRCVPRPNDFMDFADYHLRKSIIIAISHIRDERGNPFPQVQRFLVDLLTYNDNATNSYSDAFYITTVIAALGNPFVSLNQQHSDFAATPQQSDAPEQPILSAALDEVIRYANLDRLVPSYHNVVTVATIEWRIKMMMASLIPLDLKSLLAYTREGNYPAVRSAAFDGLLLLRALQEKVIARYMFAVLRFDSCRLVQRRLAQSLVENLPILAAMDDLAGQDAGYVEEDARATKKSSSQSVESMLKVLRNSIGRSIMLRDSMMAVILAPTTHLEIRWCLLKLCEVLIKPSEEPLPKIKLKMPSALRLSSTTTPASADLPLSTTGPAALPKIKLGSVDVARPEATAELQPAVSQPIKLVLGNKKIKLSKEQRSGMSLQDLKVCQNLLQKLQATKKADLFRRPVDPINDGAPSYFEHIKHPMDLSTMSHKLSAGLYKDRFAFRDDFKLMISNCYLFNGTESLPGNLAHIFDVYFDKQWERANATLEQLRLKAGFAASTAQEISPYESTPAGASTALPTQDLAAPVEHFAAPQPPAAPVQPVSVAPRPTFNLKLKLSTSGSSIQPSPPQPTPPAESAPVEPTKPTDNRQASVGPAASPRESPRLPSVPREISTAPSLPENSRSTSPAIPLAVAAPAAVNKPRFKFTTKPKVEPVDEEFTAPLPPARPSPQHSPAPRASAEPAQPKTKKIRLSIGGHGASTSQNPAPLPMATLPPVAPSLPAASPPVATPMSANGSNHGRNGYATGDRAQSVASATADSHLPVNVKKMAALLRKIASMDESYFFRRPVDPVADGCPTYYQEILHPMDLSTMQVKLNNGAYHFQQEINDDFDQIVTNCKIFNPPGTLPIAHAEAMQRYYWSEVNKLGKLSYQEKRALQGMMNRLRQKPYAGIFLEAVDPEALGIPMYFNVIPRQDARDMSLIKRRLDNDEYASFDAFEADFRLMLNNCYIFNGETSAAGEVGKMLESEFEREFEIIKNQMPSASTSSSNKSAKRGSTGPPGGGSTIKKIRLSTG